MEDKIKEIIDTLRPYMNMDGGDIEFVKYEENYVYVKMFGACQECGFQDSTLNDGLLSYLKSEIPEIEGVININL